MKSTLILGAAALAASVGAAGAAHATTGHVSGSYSTANVEYDGGSEDDIDSWGLSGAFISPAVHGVDVQFSASHENNTWDGSDYDNGQSTVAVWGTHRTGNFGFGGYFGFGNEWSQTVYMYGGEVQFYLPNATIRGVAQHGSMSDAYDYSATDLRVDATWFIMEQLAATLGVSHTDFDDYDDSATGVHVGGEYRFANSPVSISADYLWEDWDYDPGGAEGNIFRIAATWDFGTGSLQERSQTGASFGAERQFLDVWTRWD
ncbi:MAG: hypothetical protein AB7J28_16915 [Hyphomonadaceae bacterium]